MNDQERKLLHAILDKDATTTRDAFYAWSNEINFDDVEAGSFRLIPLLYKQMSSLQDSFPNKNRMQGIYRYFLYKNSILMHKSLIALETLEQERIEYILLKGAALVAAYYQEPALRPMNDIDILVKREDAEKAFQVLSNLGWQPYPGRTFQQAFHSTYSISLNRDDNVDLDLHWNVIHQAAWEGTEKSYWENTEDVPYMKRTVKILSPELQILHNLSHGIRWNALSSIRWIPDVCQVIEKRNGDIDWNLLLQEAKDKKLVFTLKHGLNLLSNEFGVAIPSSFMDDLRAIPERKAEKKLYQYLTNPSRYDVIKVQWQIYNLSRSEASLLKKLIGLPSYLKQSLSFDSYGETLRYVIKKIWKRVRYGHKTKHTHVLLKK